MYFADNLAVATVFSIILGSSCALVGLMPLHDARFGRCHYYIRSNIEYDDNAVIIMLHRYYVAVLI